MGKGNQIIRDRDGEGVTTYYFDPYCGFDEEKAAMIREDRDEIVEELRGMSFAERRRKLEQIMLEGRFPIRICDDSVWGRISRNAEDEIENVSYEIGGENGAPGFERIPRKERKFEEEIVSGSRECGVVIARSKNCEVVIADNESNIAIGCIPAQSRENSDRNVRDDEYDSIRDEVEAELYKDFKNELRRYEATDQEIDDDAEKKLAERQEKVWEESYAKFKADANAAMRKVHEFFGTQSISVRSSAWTSSSMKQYSEMTEEERNDYY